MPLTGRNCIVTGAGRGIGRATALRLAESGANVVAAARTARDLEHTVAMSLSSRGRILAQVADVTHIDQVEQLVARCESEFGGLDALINNAGVAPLMATTEMSEMAFDRLLKLNVYSVFYTCKAAWNALVTARGTIVNISSLAADDPFLGFSAYGGTKGFVNSFTRGLADEGRPLGIRVFALALGAVDTPMLRAAFPDFPAEKALKPQEVAGMIELLLDPRCTYATGEIIRFHK
jgi:NAD(P)-dependent dehydrogenase (short-subunit alcohol dehydrogenase family)